MKFKQIPNELELFLNAHYIKDNSVEFENLTRIEYFEFVNLPKNVVYYKNETVVSSDTIYVRILFTCPKEKVWTYFEEDISLYHLKDFNFSDLIKEIQEG
jgi:hypothetical protein